MTELSQMLQQLTDDVLAVKESGKCCVLSTLHDIRQRIASRAPLLSQCIDGGEIQLVLPHLIAKGKENLTTIVISGNAVDRFASAVVLSVVLQLIARAHARHKLATFTDETNALIDGLFMLTWSDELVCVIFCSLNDIVPFIGENHLEDLEKRLYNVLTRPKATNQPVARLLWGMVQGLYQQSIISVEEAVALLQYVLLFGVDSPNDAACFSVCQAGFLSSAVADWYHELPSSKQPHVWSIMLDEIGKSSFFQRIVVNICGWGLQATGAEGWATQRWTAERIHILPWLDQDLQLVYTQTFPSEIRGSAIALAPLLYLSGASLANDAVHFIWQEQLGNLKDTFAEDLDLTVCNVPIGKSFSVPRLILAGQTKVKGYKEETRSLIAQNWQVYLHLMASLQSVVKPELYCQSVRELADALLVGRERRNDNVRIFSGELSDWLHCLEAVLDIVQPNNFTKSKLNQQNKTVVVCLQYSMLAGLLRIFAAAMSEADCSANDYLLLSNAVHAVCNMQTCCLLSMKLITDDAVCSFEGLQSACSDNTVSTSLSSLSPEQGVPCSPDLRTRGEFPENHEITDEPEEELGADHTVLYAALVHGLLMDQFQSATPNSPCELELHMSSLAALCFELRSSLLHMSESAANRWTAKHALEYHGMAVSWQLVNDLFVGGMSKAVRLPNHEGRPLSAFGAMNHNTNGHDDQSQQYDVHAVTEFVEQQKHYLPAKRPSIQFAQELSMQYRCEWMSLLTTCCDLWLAGSQDDEAETESIKEKVQEMLEHFSSELLLEFNRGFTLREGKGYCSILCALQRISAEVLEGVDQSNMAVRMLQCISQLGKAQCRPLMEQLLEVVLKASDSIGVEKWVGYLLQCVAYSKLSADQPAARTTDDILTYLADIDVYSIAEQLEITKKLLSSGDRAEAAEEHCLVFLGGGKECDQIYSNIMKFLLSALSLANSVVPETSNSDGDELVIDERSKLHRNAMQLSHCIVLAFGLLFVHPEHDDGQYLVNSLDAQNAGIVLEMFSKYLIWAAKECSKVLRPDESGRLTPIFTYLSDSDDGELGVVVSRVPCLFSLLSEVEAIAHFLICFQRWASQRFDNSNAKSKKEETLCNKVELLKSKVKVVVDKLEGLQKLKMDSQLKVAFAEFFKMVKRALATLKIVSKDMPPKNKSAPSSPSRKGSKTSKAMRSPGASATTEDEEMLTPRRKRNSVVKEWQPEDDESGYSDLDDFLLSDSEMVE